LSGNVRWHADTVCTRGRIWFMHDTENTVKLKNI